MGQGFSQTPLFHCISLTSCCHQTGPSRNGSVTNSAEIITDQCAVPEKFPLEGLLQNNLNLALSFEPGQPDFFLTTPLEPPKLKPSDSSDGKESACNTGDLGSIPGWGRASGEGNGYPLQHSCLGLTLSLSLVKVKILYYRII